MLPPRPSRGFKRLSRGVSGIARGVVASLAFGVLQGRVECVVMGARSFLVSQVYLIAQAVRWKPSGLCLCRLVFPSVGVQRLALGFVFVFLFVCAPEGNSHAPGHIAKTY